MTMDDYISKAELKAAFEEDGHLSAYIEDMIDSCKPSPDNYREKVKHLEQELRDCRNELCLRCGDYRQRHLGACDGCRWEKS